jgi:hypothetical protein
MLAFHFSSSLGLSSIHIFVTLTVAVVTPVHKALPSGVSYSEPGLIFCSTEDCSGRYQPEGVSGGLAECNFLSYKYLDSPGGPDKCEAIYLSRAFISYTPENVTSLPYDVRHCHVRLIIVLDGFLDICGI